MRKLFDSFGLKIEEHTLYAFRNLETDEIIVVTSEIGTELHDRGTHEFVKEHPASYTEAVNIKYGGESVFVPTISVCGTIADIPTGDEEG